MQEDIACLALSCDICFMLPAQQKLCSPPVPQNLSLIGNKQKFAIGTLITEWLIESILMMP